MYLCMATWSPIIGGTPPSSLLRLSVCRRGGERQQQRWPLTFIPISDSKPVSGGGGNTKNCISQKWSYRVQGGNGTVLINPQGNQTTERLITKQRTTTTTNKTAQHIETVEFTGVADGPYLKTKWSSGVLRYGMHGTTATLFGVELSAIRTPSTCCGSGVGSPGRANQVAGGDVTRATYLCTPGTTLLCASIVRGPGSLPAHLFISSGCRFCDRPPLMKTQVFFDITLKGSSRDTGEATRNVTFRQPLTGSFYCEVRAGLFWRIHYKNLMVTLPIMNEIIMGCNQSFERGLSKFLRLRMNTG